jgi:uncharacterized membrane protein
MRLRHRERGQILVLAAATMVAVVGATAMVVDVGTFMIVQHQFQSAADAGALAGAWHDPICPIDDDLCLGPPQSAAGTATQLAEVNAAAVAGLCSAKPSVTVPTPGTTLNVPANVNTLVVTVECDANYSFGRILPGLVNKHISASAAAAIGNRSFALTASGAPDCKTGGEITEFSQKAPAPAAPTPAPPTPTPAPMWCGRIARLLE